jgi:hypothetical protein
MLDFAHRHDVYDIAMGSVKWRLPVDVGHDHILELVVNADPDLITNLRSPVQTNSQITRIGGAVGDKEQLISHVLALEGETQGHLSVLNRACRFLVIEQ